MATPWPEFVGGFYTARSQNIANQAAANIYTETIPGAKQKNIYGTPGRHLRVTASTVVCRGAFEENGLTLVVVGGTLSSLNTTTWTLTALGAIADDGDPVSFASNGKGGDQIGIVGGGQLKVLDTGTMVLGAAVTLPFSNPVTIAFIDGYALINQRDTPIVWFSALEDMETWDALDFFTRSGTSDNLVAIAVTRARVTGFGSKTTTQFYDSGDADTPFLPYPGSVIPYGLPSPWAMQVESDVMYWLAKPVHGPPCVATMSDPSTLKIVSTPPMALVLSQATTLADAELLVYTQEEHTFAALTCPSLGTAGNTWCYDVREQEWHQRGPFDSDSGEFFRWQARGCVAVGLDIIVGDFETGAISTLDLDIQDDVRLRRTPYLTQENDLATFDAFELGVESGVGTVAAGQGHDPVLTLRLSRDSGHTWESAGEATLGASGNYDSAALWTMLGQVRLDRLVIEVTQSDPVKCVWSAPWLRFTAGAKV